MKIFPSSLCDIYEGSISSGLKKVITDLNASRLIIIADDNTLVHCIPKLKNVIDTDYIITTKSGEHHKNLDSCKAIWSKMIEAGADRDSVVLNIGGGVVCDMGGFSAACFQRGIQFAHIPTTVLAMADAAIGGKLGVDHEGFKNYIGLIRNPAFVWVDKSFLETLARTEIISGLAEIVKHAIIGSRNLWQLLAEVQEIDDIPWDKVFELNIPVKAGIVEKDPEDKGQRKILNFGHTIGHALESYSLSVNQHLTHGQCIYLGMLIESKISATTGRLKNVDFEAIVDVIDRFRGPEKFSLPDFEKVKPWLLGDKKKSKSKIGYSLPEGIGSCVWDIMVEDHIVIESYEWLQAQAKSVPFRLSVDE